VKEEEKELMQKNVLENEPHLALFVPDNDALVFYRAICEFAQRHLKKGGWLYFEINEKLGVPVVELMQKQGFSNVELRKDLFGKDRMVRGQKEV
jgi:release factor glutamine methyltransferase